MAQAYALFLEFFLERHGTGTRDGSADGLEKEKEAETVSLEKVSSKPSQIESEKSVDVQPKRESLAAEDEYFWSGEDLPPKKGNKKDREQPPNKKSEEKRKAC